MAQYAIRLTDEDAELLTREQSVREIAEAIYRAQIEIGERAGWVMTCPGVMPPTCDWSWCVAEASRIWRQIVKAPLEGGETDDT